MQERQTTTIIVVIFFCASFVVWCGTLHLYQFSDKRHTSQDDSRRVFAPTMRRKHGQGNIPDEPASPQSTRNASLENSPDKGVAPEIVKNAMVQEKVQEVNRALQLIFSKRRASWFNIHTPVDQSPRRSVCEMYASATTHLIQSPRCSLGETFSETARSYE